jgi:hypothetical protein
MIEIQIEVRNANKVEHFPYYQKVTRDEAIQEMVDSALEPFLQSNPSYKKLQYFVTPDKSWKKLPKNLYLCFEHEKAWGYAVYAKRRRKLLFNTGEFHSVYITFNLAESENIEPLLIKYIYD